MNNVYLNGYFLNFVSVQNAKLIRLYFHIKKIFPWYYYSGKYKDLMNKFNTDNL